eukprot:732996-Ditylum_brightwellii.AAC.1
MNTNQEALQQLLTDKIWVQENLEKLFGVINHVAVTAESNQVNIGAQKLGMNSEDGPHNKRQKHGNKNAVLAEVMDAQAPDPSGFEDF